MGKIKWIVLLCCVALFGLSACNADKEQDKLGSIQWHLQKIYGEELKLSNPKDSIFIRFDLNEKRVNGRAVCNRFFGRIVVNESELEFSSMGATRMICEDAQKEDEFFRMLEEVDSFAVKEKKLYFYANKKEVATFQKVK